MEETAVFQRDRHAADGCANAQDGLLHGRPCRKHVRFHPSVQPTLERAYSCHHMYMLCSMKLETALQRICAACDHAFAQYDVDGKEIESRYEESGPINIVDLVLS